MGHDMTRPINETEADRDNQLRAIQRLKTAWESTGETITVFECRHADLSPVDFVLLRHKKMTVCLVEVKCRTNKRSKYPTLMISSAKMNKLWQHVKFGGIAFLLVKWKDSYGFWKIPEKFPDDIDVMKGGREDRGQTGDIETCWHIPIAKFKVL